MSDIVIDSSVAIAWILADEPGHEEALAFMDRIGAGTFDPVFAAHFGFEVRYALVRAARRGRLDWADIPRWLAAIDALEARLVPLSEMDAPVLGLAQRHQLTWGDANWVEIAAREDLPLLTADRRLIRSVPDAVAILIDVREAAA